MMRVVARRALSTTPTPPTPPPRTSARTQQVIKNIRTLEQRLFLVSKVMGVGLGLVLIPMALSGQFSWD